MIKVPCSAGILPARRRYGTLNVPYLRRSRVAHMRRVLTCARHVNSFICFKIHLYTSCLIPPLQSAHLHFILPSQNGTDLLCPFLFFPLLRKPTFLCSSFATRTVHQSHSHRQRYRLGRCRLWLSSIMSTSITPWSAHCLGKGCSRFTAILQNR